MSACWEFGGPGWLADIWLGGVFSAFIALGFFVALQGNARLDAKPGKDPERHRIGQRNGFIVIAVLVVMDRVRNGLTEVAFPLMMLVPVAAAVLTVRVARRQAAEVPMTYLMPLSAVRGPARWSVPIAGGAAVAAVVSVTVVSYIMGHALC